MKALKKNAILLLMFALATVFFTTMSANAEEERTVIYLQTPEDWDTPCVWAWDEEGNNAFAAWPGGETEADANNAGWYYIWVPSWANHIIINANEGNVQTGELILEGGNTWITVADPENAEVSYDALTKGSAPEYVEKFEIHASIPDSWDIPCLRAWSAADGINAFEEWPGEPLKQGEDGWYTGKAPIWVNSVSINANEGSVQTEDISIDPAEMWITVEEDGSYDFSYDDPNAVSVPDINVYVKTPDDWATPCLWAWSAPDGTNVFTSWPGEPFVEEDGWLTLSVPGWINSVIITGNEGDTQTSDISVETGKDIWLVVTGAEEYEVFYEEPAIDDTSTGSEDTADGEEDKEVNIEESDVSSETQEAENTGMSAGVIGLIAVIGIIIAGFAGYFIYKKKK